MKVDGVIAKYDGEDRFVSIPLAIFSVSITMPYIGYPIEKNI